jgi:hypothetical protein
MMTVEEFADRVLNPLVEKAQQDGRLPPAEIAERMTILERRILALELVLSVMRRTKPRDEA